MSSETEMEARILKEATKLFLEKGFKGTSTIEIAKEAGCNQALVHYYFRSKEKLFLGVFNLKLKLFLSKFMEIEEEDLTFSERIEKMIRTHFRILLDQPRLPFLIFTELNSDPERLKRIRENLGDLPRETLRQLRAQLEMEIRFERVRKIALEDLLLTIISLNVSAFLLRPMFQMIANMDDTLYEELLRKRIEENVLIVKRSLEP